MGQPCDPRYNASVEKTRDDEYPMIKDAVYLDHAGSTLCSKSLLESFAREMTTTLYGNPHSASWPSQLSTTRIDDIRLQLLTFFRADPRDFDLIFVANATAGVKLVVEGMRSMPGGYAFVHHQECHTSVVGAREESAWSHCVDNEAVTAFLDGGAWDGTPIDDSAATLFAYSAQSHFDGSRYPLSWANDVREMADDRILTLLDASSLCATSQLDLSNSQLAPDFVVLSLYKIFGFPDLGVLIVRKPAEDIFAHRKYFGGGTVDMVVCGRQQWHAAKSQALHQRLEDGTLPFHNIIAAGSAIGLHRQLFGDMDSISAHVSFLANQLRNGLQDLKHANGSAVSVIYGERSNICSPARGAIVAFNLRDSRGAWVSLTEFEKLANLKKMYIRTGGLCSPGGIASALGLEPWEMKRNFSAGFRCGAEDDIVVGKPTGVVRASLGPMSILSDVTRFIDFLDEYFVEKSLFEDPTASEGLADESQWGSLRVKAVTVYPIKSCGGYDVPPGQEWEVRPEGLAWDREWCLVHRGSSQALSQKRYPRMALLRPSLDLEAGVLRVIYVGTMQGNKSAELSIPLAEDPSLFEAPSLDGHSRVCGDAVSTLRYTSDEINEYFSDALGVPCVLTRLPAGGRGLASRMSKARMQSHQQKAKTTFPGSFPGVPSPPDSDSEHQAPGKILLSNESPILLVYSASIDHLNQDISKVGGTPVTDSSFRANIIVEPSGVKKGHRAYAEDTWRNIRIGEQYYKLLGACRRCQMVCVNQETGEKGQEPLSTLAKTRRFDGKTYFGAHMRHDPQNERTRKAEHTPCIRVGELVLVEESERS